MQNAGFIVLLFYPGKQTLHFAVFLVFPLCSEMIYGDFKPLTGAETALLVKAKTAYCKQWKYRYEDFSYNFYLENENNMI